MSASEATRVLVVYCAAEVFSSTIASARLAALLAQRGKQVSLGHAGRVDARAAAGGFADRFVARGAASESTSFRSVVLPGDVSKHSLSAHDPLAYVEAVERECDVCSVLVLDCDPAFGPISGVLPLLADDLVLLTPARPAALADAYAALKWLHHRGLRAEVRLIVLHSGDREQGLHAARRLQRTAHQFLGRAVTYLGAVPGERSARNTSRVRGVSSLPSAPVLAAWNAVTDGLLGAAPAGAESSLFWLRLAQLFL